MGRLLSNVIVKTVLVWNLLSSSKSSCLRNLLDIGIVKGEMGLRVMIFSEGRAFFTCTSWKFVAPWADNWRLED